ncbi:MAG TPA: bifunctional oligoribonuclease/PAP phosphatase NrnA [Pirellulaceae bacterium]|nr:bifunctional oligoribonuclease/PAP phosphatase NrnA [Pirellulaceae bacterium]HMO93393.1 bifunctional oligoribonuclease/PAP phosphatase NrnA [Pirellulaceae bacterium]HMP70453.1 bifunctional oligoribonuclease/PAP phosphatase NrnA [Pirellulaceae bacterium]
MTKIDWQELWQYIEPHQNIVLTSHIRPDCDALGSELGLAILLESKGKTVRIVNGHATPPNLAFIDPENRILHFAADVQAAELSDAEVLIILDTSAFAQLKPMEGWIKSFAGKTIVIDHHLGEDDFSARLFKDITSEATGRLIAECAEAWGFGFTTEFAQPIFAALATDTGWFRFGSVSETTYQLAAKLVAAGAVPADIYASLYEQETLGRVKLRGRVLSRIQLELDGRLAHTHILKGDYAETGALPTDTEDLINECLEIAGVEFAIILIEQPEGGFKVSFRSRCDLACNEIAAHFNGGGHRAAAGAFVKQEFAIAKPLVLDFVIQQMQQAAI